MRIYSLSIVTDWSSPPVGDDEYALFLPALARFPAALRELMAVLPIVDINGELLAALRAASGQDGRPSCPPADGIVAGLFAPDPFLDAVELEQALRNAGVARVANFPTVQLFDGVTAASFASVGYDVAAELSVLKALQGRGFEPLVYLTSAATAAAALTEGFATLVYHAGLRPGRGDRSTLARIEQMAGEAGARVLRHRSGTKPLQPSSP